MSTTNFTGTIIINERFILIMPKIFNYSPHHDASHINGYRWKHDSQEGLIVNVKENNNDNKSYWCIEIWDYTDKIELDTTSTNKSECRKMAVQWMKENPQGWKSDL